MTVYYKIRQMLLQNVTAVLLQNATEVYYKISQVFCYKMQPFYYKMRHLLQIATFITNSDSTPNNRTRQIYIFFFRKSFGKAKRETS